jgi:2-C-methyl-D-erythritol 4-phosphate cytidylyltransferase/2-C-methyl-D-erythritol 2,4-cyclodiphosphate synthase
LTAADGPSPADAVVVAAGSSQRMGGLDKLAWTVGDRPLLAHTLEALAAAPSVGSIVVVTAPVRREELAAAPWLPAAVGAVVAGGERRQDSVLAGMAALETLVPDPDGRRVVLVHDGARPLVTPDLIESVVAGSARYGAAIPVLPIAETVKRVADDRILETVPRGSLVTAQTPQGIRRDVLRQALASPMATGGTWTDEAALLEACSITVHVLPGDPANVKVTVPSDLDRVAAALAPGARRRTGIGHDGHPFGPGSPLRLGGLTFEGVPRLVGHSDGDVALHAVADALLGAAGLGDLGRVFPAGPATPEGIDSGTMLQTVIDQLGTAGWRPVAVDLTIVAARPRLGARLEAMRDRLAGILGLASEAVSVKASTGNLDGSEGAGRSISALALATIEAIG